MSKKTSKSERAAIAAKRKRMGLKAVDDDDLDDGVAYDPQLVTVAKCKKFLSVFEKKAGSLHGSVSLDEFRECLELLEIDVPSSDSRKAFNELDLENEEELEFEPFVSAIFVASPTYNVVWNSIMKKKKYYHYRTIEGPYSEEQLKGILKTKNSDFKDKLTALRCCLDTIGSPEIKDKETKQAIVKLLPGLLAALRDKNQSVVREACLSLALMCKAKKACFKNSVSKILNVCWELFDVDNELIKYSSNNLSKCLLKYVPDDADNKVLKTLIQGCNLKGFEGVQRGCYDGIKMYLKKAGNPKAKKKPNKEFWELTKKIVKEGIAKTDDKLTKERCYELLVAMEKADEKKAKRIILALNKKQEAEYKNIKDGHNMNDIPDDDEKDNDDDEERAEWEPDKSKRGPRELSRDYDERKEELGESFDAYDDEGEGWISIERAQQFLRDLFDVTGQDADIAIRGLDVKFDGHIVKARMLKWALAHSWKKVRKNLYLQNEAKKFGYGSSRKERLEQRLELFEKLKEIEVAEHNYPALYDIDHRMCVLKYCNKNAKK